MLSTAVNSNAISAVTGIKWLKGYFNNSAENLPQNINIFGEANTANQSGLSTTPWVMTSLAEVISRYGAGSPIYKAARILTPVNGTGATVPITIYPQLAAESSVAKVITVTPTGDAKANGTIYLKICGREVEDNGNYAINIINGDTPTLICDKFRAAIAANLGCTVLGTGTSTFIATAKWTGLTSNDITISVDLGTTSLGTTYAVVNTTAGSGTPSVTASLAMMSNEWRTLVVNTYGLVSATMLEFEAYNGIPDPTSPTGQFSAIIQRSMLVLSGSVLDNPTSITSAGVRPNNCTIVSCVAPLSLGLPLEAAANVARIIGNMFNDTPQSDPIGQYYPDMPAPAEGSIPAMNVQATRDAYVKLGCSTVEFIAGRYRIVDLVTTYNPTGESVPFYRWARDMNVYNNFTYRYRVLQQRICTGKVLVGNDDVVTASNTIKPKEWDSEVSDLIDQSVADALLTDAPFMKATLRSEISSVNPNRMDTILSVKITGINRINSTDLTLGFNFGG